MRHSQSRSVPKGVTAKAGTAKATKPKDLTATDESLTTTTKILTDPALAPARKSAPLPAPSPKKPIPTPAPTSLPAADLVEFVDLGEDLIEELSDQPAPCPTQRETVQPPPRHRHATLRSAIPAQLAESMMTGLDERALSPQLVPDAEAQAIVVEMSAPFAVDLTLPTPTTVDRPVPTPIAVAAVATAANEIVPEIAPDAAIPMAAIHDDITVQVMGLQPAPDTVVALPPWSNPLAQVALATLAPNRPALPCRRLASFDLRGVFCSDGATIATDPVLPDTAFALPTRERARLSASAGTSSRSVGAATGGAGLHCRREEGDGRADRAGARSAESQSAPAHHRVSGRRPHEETLPRGAIIDKYRIERLLGKGGFAAVYRATHLLLNTQVAIKLLRPQVLARHAHLAKLLYEEARFAARIDHPNVVKVFDVTHTSNITYIVMEYIDGRSLADTITRGRALPWQRVVEIGTAVAEGLKVALDARLIHRDIKPANILLGKRGEIKIVDLGLVLRAGTIGPEPSGGEPETQAAGRRAAIGTFGYMAPEQAIDPERIDFRADIYALGATLYEAAVGVPCFPLANAARCLEMHAHEPPPPPESRRPGLPPEFSALLLRMLAKKPDDRFASYDALIATLEHLGALGAQETNLGTNPTTRD